VPSDYHPKTSRSFPKNTKSNNNNNIKLQNRMSPFPQRKIFWKTEYKKNAVSNKPQTRVSDIKNWRIRRLRRFRDPRKTRYEDYCSAAAGRRRDPRGRAHGTQKFACTARMDPKLWRGCFSSVKFD
jgi:hypothetical protein